MKSYGTASRSTLGTLLDLRAKDERDAEQALAAAASARRKAEAEQARLVEKLRAAHEAAAVARRDSDNVGATGERAADAQTRRRFWARLDEAAAAADAALARYRKEDLARALDADAAARAAHVRARQRREVVEKAIVRRQAAARREADRREEAIQDDRYAGVRARTKTPTTGK